MKKIFLIACIFKWKIINRIISFNCEFCEMTVTISFFFLAKSTKTECRNMFKPYKIIDNHCFILDRYVFTQRCVNVEQFEIFKRIVLTSFS